MIQFISFDMDGTLIDSTFTDWVWGHGLPALYAGKTGLPFDKAKEVVEREYKKVGEGAIEWYDIKYWFRFFELGDGWKPLLEQYGDKVRVYPDVLSVLESLQNRAVLILTSNAGREFIDVELGATGLRKYFHQIFSVTSDFNKVKKTADVYHRICRILEVDPQEIIHVGDHFEFDYRVPQAMGIRAFYLDRSDGQRGDTILGTLSDLEGRLSDGLMVHPHHGQRKP
jgi:HAD superfamily hydrolase (TIGR01549 family)